ncbi:DNA recombination protein RmuC [Chitinophaga sedimenti]|uniref:DNA recombination protein RmuC n=1 Tax=Chitinophaga sedimenti TaxID=2033606 RepID=UPI0027E15E22|nr:DNA recombination protein RmuC [Chitinophaga sedimenti]
MIDSKVSLNAYVEYFNAADPAQKKESLKQLVRNINDHIDLLANKNYQSLAGLHTPDFVFMFMHFESALTLAMNENPDIFNRALQRKIVIITPTTLVATMKVVKLLWQKENRVKNVEEIFRQCGLLYDKFVLFTEEMQKVGKSITDAGRAYHDAMNRLRDGARKSDTIIGKFQLIQSLEAKTNRKLPDSILNEISLLDNNE